MTTQPPVNVRITRRYDAPPERVFDAWLDRAMIGRWMFGPALREEEVLRVEVDACLGGSFSFLVRRGEHEIDHVGQYLELARPRRLAFTWGIREHLPDTSRVAIDIVPQGRGCELTLTHELHPDWVDYAKRTEDGWAKMLSVLGAVLNEDAAPKL